MRINTLIRYLITLLLLALAVWLGKALWDHYMHSPWTRDGRVRADVITLSADVAGLVTQVAVKDNQPVRKGDVLFVVDRSRYAAALTQAEAALEGQRTEKNRRGKEAARRDGLDSAVVSAENRETAAFAAAAAGSQYQAALAARDLARLNLERTVVRAPVDGYVTNLNVHAGDFAAVGAPKLALIDRNSYRVEGYFEETKLPMLKPGAKVEITLLSGGPTLSGRVASIARGITDRDAGTGRELLADVNPTFNWVRLAQRVPVRIELDALPAGQLLVAGTTCTVVVR
ncbi:efflux RND transporter periplasmic adaptor subunit [Chromobacterium sp. S0633]|uniref:efflux RND transporter periplasmic adaptor subunit n=1 Tax=Chromobacterium sp. S0633 TaxID=2957805 RepID=UPI0020A09FBD|nr:efflux RND transporter periplasmic adaptor subunit [Chromobacterium sp. S0633]MCP1288927.1 efflux RND transporter periplasmic adaptor subunit [Chromobacterium sp. S0633]